MERNTTIHFTIEGEYSNYQIQQIIAERIFALQGNQNQTFKVRSVNQVHAHKWHITIYALSRQRKPPAEPESLDPLNLYEGPGE